MSVRECGREKQDIAGGINVSVANRVFMSVRTVEGMESKMMRIVKVSVRGQERIILIERPEGLSFRSGGGLEGLFVVLIVGRFGVPFV